MRPADGKKRPSAPHLCGFGSLIGAFKIPILQRLMVEFGLVEQNGPFVPLLLAVFGGFAAGLIGLFVLLRNKAKLLFALFGSEL